MSTASPLADSSAPSTRLVSFGGRKGGALEVVSPKKASEVPTEPVASPAASDHAASTQDSPPVPGGPSASVGDFDPTDVASDPLPTTPLAEIPLERPQQAARKSRRVAKTKKATPKPPEFVFDARIRG